MQFGEFLIGRQPILDAEEGTVAYELLFRSPESLAAADFSDQVGATSRVLVNIIHNFGLDAIVGRHPGFVNVNEDILLNDVIDVLPADRIIFEILEHTKVTPELVARIKEYKSHGYRFAIDDIIMDDEFLETFKPLLPLADVFKVDIMGSTKEGIKDKIGVLKRFKAKLLAEKVETHEDFQYCMSLGFDYYQGYFFAKPRIMKTTSIEPSRLAILKIMRMLSTEADIESIEKEFKIQPEMSVNLLKFLNSSSFYMRGEVRSIKHALTLIGRKQLLKWLTLMLYAGQGKPGVQNPYLETALLRAKTMEIVMEAYLGRRSDSDNDDAHYTGLLSILDSVFNISMEDLCDTIKVARNIREALLYRDGILGKMLTVVEVSDNARQEDIMSMMDELRVTAEIVTQAKIQAMNWLAANQITQ